MVAEGIGETETGSKLVPAGWGEGIGNAGIAGENPASWRTWENKGLLTRNDGLNFIPFFMPWRADVVTNPIIESEIGLDAPAILSKKAKIEISAVGGIRLSLNE